MLLRTLESRRITLVAADAGLLEADLNGRRALAEYLSATVPDNWPPLLFERPAMIVALEQCRADPGQVGWQFWYLLDRSGDRPSVLGLAGFKGRPDSSGCVEISYSIIEQMRNHGYATEAVVRLVTWAFSHQNVREVAAETMPHLRQSIRVMEKNGFKYTGAGSEQGVIRYAVRKEDLR